ncbi:hypothetical protein HZS_552 [Henneguya salminicola]|nr:hypothetical protein HZS_552 [Henneguya salminicola]
MFTKTTGDERETYICEMGQTDTILIFFPVSYNEFWN